MFKTNSGKKRRILAIDDSIELLEDLQFVIEDEGYLFEGYFDHEEALKKYETTEYDIVIVDFMLKGIKGDKIVEKIKKIRSDQYILLLTGYATDVPPKETMDKLDIQGYCIKGSSSSNISDATNLITLIKSGLKAVDMMNEIKRTKEGLSNILKVIPQIYKLSPIEDILETIIISVMKLIVSRNAFVIVDVGVNNNDKNQNIFKAIGKYDLSINDFFQKILTERINSDNDTISQLIGYAREKKQNIIADKYVFLPLIDEVARDIGIICIESEEIEGQMQLLEIFSKQVATSISNAFLHLEINMKEEQLSDSFAKLEQSYADTIQILRLAIDEKSSYTRGHSDRVGFYCEKIGAAFDCDEDDIKILKLAGLFHDIGKIGVKDNIIHKEGKLNEEELREMQTHPIRGSRMLKAVSGFENIAPIVRAHHQWYGGGEKSYPDKIEGEEIPFLSRILAVADSFDAMDSRRSYRDNLQMDDIKKQLRDGRATQFDAKIVDRFLELVEEYYEEWREELSHTFDVPEYKEEGY